MHIFIIQLGPEDSIYTFSRMTQFAKLCALFVTSLYFVLDLNVARISPLLPDLSIESKSFRTSLDDAVPQLRRSARAWSRLQRAVGF